MDGENKALRRGHSQIPLTDSRVANETFSKPLPAMADYAHLAALNSIPSRLAHNPADEILSFFLLAGTAPKPRNSFYRCTYTANNNLKNH